MGWSEYLSDVLGIKHFYGAAPAIANGFQLWSEQGYVDTSYISDKTQILFVHRVMDDSIFQGASFEMFLKITQAMKLEGESFQLLETNSSATEVVKALQKVEFAKILVWFEGDGRTKAPEAGFKIFTVPSPVAMVEKADLKKSAWDTLKKIMQINEGK